MDSAGANAPCATGATGATGAAATSPAPNIGMSAAAISAAAARLPLKKPICPATPHPIAHPSTKCRVYWHFPHVRATLRVDPNLGPMLRKLRM